MMNAALLFLFIVEILAVAAIFLGILGFLARVGKRSFRRGGMRHG